MKSETWVELADEPALLQFARRLAPLLMLTGGTKVYLRGDLGAGKTTFCRGILQGLGHKGAVKSPTYTLVEPYELAGQRVYHFDLYRLGDPSELEYMGFRDYFDEQSLCLVEWPEQGAGALPVADLEVRIEVSGTGRRLACVAHTAQGRQVLAALADVPG